MIRGSNEIQKLDSSSDDEEDGELDISDLSYMANKRLSNSSRNSGKTKLSKSRSSKKTLTSSSSNSPNFSNRQDNMVENNDSNGIPVRYSFVFASNEYKMITENHLLKSTKAANENHKYYKAVCYYLTELDETLQHTGNIRNVKSHRTSITTTLQTNLNNTDNMFNHMKSILYKLIPLAIGNVDTQNAEDYFNWMGEELTKSFAEFVGPRKRKYISDVATESDDDENYNTMGATLIPGSKEDHSLCRVFLLGFLLQFLLLTTPSKPKQPKPSSTPTTKKQQDKPDSLQSNNDTDCHHLPSTTINLHTPMNINTPNVQESTSNVAPNVEESQSVKVSAPPKKATTNVSNFFILQEAARMELTRTLELVTKAITACDTSLISLSNTDNFMHLVAQQRGVRDLQNASFFNIPLRHTFLDYVRYELRTDIRVPGRYPWDKEVSVAEEKPLTSFARLVFEPKHDKGQQDRVPSWEGNVTLIQGLLQDVTGHAMRLHDLLSELRSVNDVVFFMRVKEKKPTDIEVNKSKIYKYYNDMHNDYKVTLGEHELLLRTYDNNEDDNMDFAVMSEDNFTNFDNTSYLNQCENKVKELVELPYNYNILHNFLFQDRKKIYDCDIQSLSGKLSEFGILVSSFKKVLTRKLDQVITETKPTSGATTESTLPILPTHPAHWVLTCQEKINRIIGQVDYNLTSLQRMLMSSDLNIWLSCLLSKQRFLVTNPLIKPDYSTTTSASTIYRTKEEMADTFGTALFARIAIWGYNVYVINDEQFLPAEYQKSVEQVASKNGILGLTNAKTFPSVQDVQRLLKRSITSLNAKQFALFQCILLDFWALQPFAQPIPFENRTSKRKHQANEKEENDNDLEHDRLSDLKKQKNTDFTFFQKAAKASSTTSAASTPANIQLNGASSSSTISTSSPSVQVLISSSLTSSSYSSSSSTSANKSSPSVQVTAYSSLSASSNSNLSNSSSISSSSSSSSSSASTGAPKAIKGTSSSSSSTSLLQQSKNSIALSSRVSTRGKKQDEKNTNND